MSRSRRGRFAAVSAACVALAVGLSACGNAKAGTSTGGNGAPGVTATQINVGSIANVTGPLSSDFAPVVNGVQAYFSMINAEGGVAGRTLNLAYQEDDQGSPTIDLSVAQKLVQQDNVFAVVGVGTPFFGGASFLAQQGTPTFGYSVSTDWANRPTLFADYGSVLCFPCGAPGDAYLAQQLGAKSIAVVSYGVPQSAAACKAAVTGMKAMGLNVSFSDLNLVFGADPTPDVLQMKNANADMWFSCLDVNGNVALRPGHHARTASSMKQVWFNGYDRGTLQQYGSIMNGVYFGLQHVPFEAALAYPGVYPGLDTYIREMEKYQPSFTYDEVALDGWISADQFVTGLKAVGRNLTQKKLVAAINKETAYNGAGLTTPVDWTKAHTTPLRRTARPTSWWRTAHSCRPSSSATARCSRASICTAPLPVPPLPGHPGPSGT